MKDFNTPIKLVPFSSDRIKPYYSIININKCMEKKRLQRQCTRQTCYFFSFLNITIIYFVNPNPKMCVYSWINLYCRYYCYYENIHFHIYLIFYGFMILKKKIFFIVITNNFCECNHLRDVKYEKKFKILYTTPICFDTHSDWCKVNNLILILAIIAALYSVSKCKVMIIMNNNVYERNGNTRKFRNKKCVL